jgi:hypothetical protein
MHEEALYHVAVLMIRLQLFDVCCYVLGSAAAKKKGKKAAKKGKKTTKKGKKPAKKGKKAAKKGSGSGSGR